MIMSVALMTASAGCQFRAVVVLLVAGFFFFTARILKCSTFENIYFHLEPQRDYLSQFQVYK